MSKRKYTHIQEILPEIQVMIANGKSHREIEEFLGLTGDRPVHNLLKRERRGGHRTAKREKTSSWYSATTKRTAKKERCAEKHRGRAGL